MTNATWFHGLITTLGWITFVSFATFLGIMGAILLLYWLRGVVGVIVIWWNLRKHGKPLVSEEIRQQQLWRLRFAWRMFFTLQAARMLDGCRLISDRYEVDCQTWIPKVKVKK